MERMQVATTAREQMVNITLQMQSLVTEKGWEDGAVVLFCPHTTAAVTTGIIGDHTVVRDFLVSFRRMVPRRGDYQHETNADAHIKASILGPSLQLLVRRGLIQFGSWQGLFFCEFDGPRKRELWLQWVEAGA
jgi:secondary thiamine-phosphate synthase enzyme